ncbi:hypothetical protein [Marivirga sp.]|uniref:hypothetical protein n=1 Tax=Marivirga sp. TaxID=2018662 RepID=UPI002D80ACFA|nr:hypothetical protein [Marivirga sp.]HET8858328.1 hypothetical protein [Marivirga sp.]
MKTINLPPTFIASDNYEGKILNSFKKHPTQNIFFIVENEKLDNFNAKRAVKIRLKWYNSDSGEYGEEVLPNYMRIHQVMSDGTVILLDRNSKEDTYLNFYELLNKENV